MDDHECQEKLKEFIPLLNNIISNNKLTYLTAYMLKEAERAISNLLV